MFLYCFSLRRREKTESADSIYMTRGSVYRRCIYLSIYLMGILLGTSALILLSKEDGMENQDRGAGGKTACSITTVSAFVCDQKVHDDKNDGEEGEEQRQN